MTLSKQKPFAKRLATMLRVDARRLLVSPLFYLMVGISLAMPILILVMTTMFGTTDATGGATDAVAMEGFTNVWQIIGSVSTAEQSASMSLVSMCNVNMIYFAAAIFASIFVTEDFRSGFAKSLFTVRASKADYVTSKTLICWLSGVAMILLFLIGSLIGGKIAGLSFALEGFTAANLVWCLLAKLLLVGIFSGAAVLAGAIAKHRRWVAICAAFAFGMLLFAMIPIITPLDATAIHALLCAVGGAGFAAVFAVIAKLVLDKTTLV